ncbi:hypothetical protein [Catellatospora tritici]|uniref:hypothetical protein n=1 Tax=Catellatospora tritici TaxID=2851566 RepID=UPI001C2DADDA|nr:hypothetical protein [Catellatospora tritici]MBV1855203.1 hypothetical protein [Catellatospora tritici]
MSILTDYFAAGSDRLAATAAEYVHGQLSLLDLAPEKAAANKHLHRVSPEQASRPRVETAHSGTLVLQSKGVDPGLALARLEAILTGRTHDEVCADPRQAAQIAPARPEDIDGRVVLSVTDTLRDALASAEVSALPRVARQWAIAESANDAEESLALFLIALTDLARRAGGRAERLYCCVTF